MAATFATKRYKQLKPDFGSSSILSINDDAEFWQKGLEKEEIIKDYGSIDSIDYNRHDLDELLVTSYARSSIYDTETLAASRTFKCHTQFQVYGGSYRQSDGRLVAMGSEEGKIFIYESKNTNPLRILVEDKYKAPTRRVLFNSDSVGQLISFSDDTSVKLWDIGSGQIIKAFGDLDRFDLSKKQQQPTRLLPNIVPSGSSESKNSDSSIYHRDYVRSGCIIDNLIASGSYDHFVKVWDPRSERPVFQYDHGRPVECLANRASTLLISVGGTTLRVFDMVAGKTITNIQSNHHKTITSCVNFEDKYLLTGSLDGHLNILNFNYDFITRLSFDNLQILSLAANRKLLAVGFSNHEIRVRKFKNYLKKSQVKEPEFDVNLLGANTVTRYFHQAIAESADPEATKRAMLAINQNRVAPAIIEDEKCLIQPVIVKSDHKKRKETLKKYEKYLLGFQHSEALNKALKSTNDPDSVATLLLELIKRNKLRSALSGCTRLKDLLDYIALYIRDIRFSRTLTDVAIVLLQLFYDEPSTMQVNNPNFWKCIGKLQAAIYEEIKIIETSNIIKGQLDVILSQAL